MPTSTLRAIAVDTGSPVGNKITVEQGFEETADLIDDLQTQADATDVIVDALPILVSGTYTPTLTNISNVTSSGTYSAQYLRVGNTVQVSGRFDCQATATGIVTIDLSIPIASDFTTGEHLCGSGGSNSGFILRILAESTNDRARITYNAPTTSNTALAFIFSYRIL